jgi:hypothetical protein
VYHEIARKVTSFFDNRITPKPQLGLKIPRRVQFRIPALCREEPLSISWITKRPHDIAIFQPERQNITVQRRLSFREPTGNPTLHQIPRHYTRTRYRYRTHSSSTLRNSAISMPRSEQIRNGAPSSRKLPSIRSPAHHSTRPSNAASSRPASCRSRRAGSRPFRRSPMRPCSKFHSIGHMIT